MTGEGPGQVSSDGVCGLHSQGGMICLDLSKVTGLLCKGFQGGKRNTRGGGWSLTRILSQPKKADRAGRQRLAASSGPWAMRPQLAWGPESRQISREACVASEQERLGAQSISCWLPGEGGSAVART